MNAYWAARCQRKPVAEVEKQFGLPKGYLYGPSREALPAPLVAALKGVQIPQGGSKTNPAAAELVQAVMRAQEILDFSVEPGRPRPEPEEEKPRRPSTKCPVCHGTRVCPDDGVCTTPGEPCFACCAEKPKRWEYWDSNYCAWRPWLTEDLGSEDCWRSPETAPRGPWVLELEPVTYRHTVNDKVPYFSRAALLAYGGCLVNGWLVREVK